MINLDLIQCICRNMLCRLLQITDSRCMGIKFNDHIKTFICHRTLVLTKAHSLQDLRKCESGEDDLLLFRCIIRDINNRKTGHDRRTDLIFFISSCNRIYPNCRNITLDIVVGKSEVIKKC